MPRPTLLVAEPEPDQALSTRKLVLETGKFNVLTAHSTLEALDVLRQFPNISAAVLVDSKVIDCDRVAAGIRKASSKLPIIALSPHPGYSCPAADHHLSSYEPQELLDLIRSLVGDPRRIDVQNKGNPREKDA